jgi:N-acetylglucosamine-6-sulfatase
MLGTTLLVVLASLVGGLAADDETPNIVFFLTDDQDQVLGAAFPLTQAVTPMPKTLATIAQQGITATNFYIHTPICCPSRAETLTGRYLQNVKLPPVQKQCSDAYNGHDSNNGTCCMHVDEPLVNNATFARYLKEQAGYTVGMFGKYLNVCPHKAPPGFDAWFANGGGSYFNPSFSVQNIDGLDDSPNMKFQANSKYGNYSTALIGNYSIEWIRKVAKGDKPFLAYIAPKAAHDPFQPADWYADYWSPDWPETAPRPPSWNLTSAQLANHHPTVAGQDPLTETVAECIDGAFKNRWRTLMSVDDVIQDVADTIESLGLMDSTYFLYTSDHGYQLGELNMPQDKRNVYEFDVKIHLIIRGPGIRAGSTFDQIASNVDLAPTMLSMAGVLPPADMDGKSFLPLIITQDYATSRLPDQTSSYLQSHPAEGIAAGWRKSHFIQHHRVGAGSYCGPNHHIDGMDNNFIAVRHLNYTNAAVTSPPFKNLLYAEFQWANGTDYGMGNVDFKTPFFFELYDMTKDPWQINNIYQATKTTSPGFVASLHNEVHQWFACKGASCM